MKKIMFNEQFGLQQATFDGIKTMTRRVVPNKIMKDALAYQSNHIDDEKAYEKYILGHAQYKVGEVVAIAQSYYEVYHSETPLFGDSDEGVFNKMFVKAERMPHHIRILRKWQEQLQDISDEDCMKEGIKEGEFCNTWDRFYFESRGDVPNPITFKTPREAFSELIDRVSGKSTWESNPLVWAYEFKLID